MNYKNTFFYRINKAYNNKLLYINKKKSNCFILTKYKTKNSFSYIIFIIKFFSNKKVKNMP